MKQIKCLAVAGLLCIAQTSFAQLINWKNLSPLQKHILSVNVGLDYGAVVGIGYSKQLKTKLPALLDISYSFPSGEKLLDDFKVKIGGRVRVYKIDNIQFSVSAHGTYRRFQNPLVRLQNFGSEMKAVAGYYRPRWFVAGEMGFDKAIVTHFKHSAEFKSSFPEVRDGWYEPSTGGVFSYGIQTGYWFNNSAVTLEAGKLMNQDFQTKPLVPLYIRLGYNLAIK